MASSTIKLEKTRLVAHPSLSAPSSTASDSFVTVKPRRRNSQASQDENVAEVQTLQDKSKKERATSFKQAAAKGSIMTMSNLIPGEEITYTPTTHRISKAKKGKKVHNCTFPGCPKIFTRAEHRRRHEANHNAHPAFQCQVDGCKKPFQRADLLARHMERQHNAPIDASSTRSERSRGSMSDISTSPGGGTFAARHWVQQHLTSPHSQASGSTSIGSVIENSNLQQTEYRTHSVPPSLQDQLASAPIGTAPRSLHPELLYGLSPSGDSLYSSSDSCYSPLSDYLQAPQPISQQYHLGSETLQRPHSALGTCYQSLEASPMSMGPPTPGDGPSWGGCDPLNLGFTSDTQCLPSQRHYQQAISPTWTSTGKSPVFEDATPTQSPWAWMKVGY